MSNRIPQSVPVRRQKAAGARGGALVQRFGLVVAWLVIIAAFGILRPTTFLTIANLSTVLGSQAVIAVLTLALLIPLTSGDMDLSIAFTLTLSSMLVAQLNVQFHWPILAAILVAILVGAAIGTINGAVATGMGIDPFIVTLGTGTFVGGIVLWISASNTVSGVSPALVRLVVADHFLGIPLEFYYSVALYALVWYVFEYTRPGRLLLIVGRGRSVAHLSGIHVPAVRMAGFMASGALSAAAGVLYVGTTGAADPTSGTQFLLPAFAGAFLGATVIVPGKFNPWGSLIAVYFLVTGITGLQMLGAEGFVQDLFYGGALVLAVSLSHVVRRRRALNDQSE
ncbi:MAG TPA: ABC transporter permease [Spirochaetia bacterium]|nr:ABC transporter permease [Spirochaetia bacterium]